MQASMNAVACWTCIKKAVVAWYLRRPGDEQTGAHLCHYHSGLAGTVRLLDLLPGDPGRHRKYGGNTWV